MGHIRRRIVLKTLVVSLYYKYLLNTHQVPSILLGVLEELALWQRWKTGNHKTVREICAGEVKMG